MIRAATLEELSSLPGINRKVAEVIKKGLSVREAERLATQPEKSPRAAKAPKEPEITDLEEKLTSTLGAKVLIHHRKKDKGGRVEIQYHNLDELDRIIDILSK